MTTPHPRLLLIGYRGTGKTTVGQLLAAALGWEFADADEAVERAAGATITELFAAEGEAGFRDREAAALADLCRTPGRVIATGGGAILRPANRDLLRSSGYVAWLHASPEAAWQRLHADPLTAARRPNLTASGGLQEVAAVMAAREPLYRATAAGVFPTDGRSPDAVAASILAAWDS